MHQYCFVFSAATGATPQIQNLRSLVDLVKTTPEGLCRSMFFFPVDNAGQAMAAAGQETLPLSGPLTITHAIRRAGDMVLENCSYDGMTVFLEVDGRKLPELPPRSQVESLLAKEKTLINIDGKGYRPNTEVFGFQQVYDDTVKTIESLKALGITQEAMLILATPDEITIEIHPGVFGLPEDAKLAARYRAFLFQVAGVRAGGRQVVKQADRTVVLDSADFSATTLLPGSVHQTLHRPKVCVGPSHFAYGPAAFSDYCGKKRNTDDCLKEIRAWIKFLETPLSPVEKVKTTIDGLAMTTPPAPPPLPAAGGKGPGPAPTGGFQPVKAEILEQLAHFPDGRPPISTGFPELNKMLGGGWKPRGIHLITGSREEGKTSFLVAQACALAEQAGVLFVSRELGFREFLIRVLSWYHKVPMAEVVAKASLGGAEGPVVKEKLKSAMKACSAGLADGLFFRGTDSSLDPMQADELAELIKLVPGTGPKVLILDGFSAEDLDRHPGFLETLRQKSEQQDIAVICSVHVPASALPRPHLIEGADLDLLARWQKTTDALLFLTSDRANLKKFLAISQGKVDPAVAEKLEQKLYQTVGTKRMRGDTYLFCRCLHTRTGVRNMLLFLCQRDIQRFGEGTPVPLGRP